MKNERAHEIHYQRNRHQLFAGWINHVFADAGEPMKIISDDLRMCRLQSIIDQAPHAHSAREARELLEKLKRRGQCADDFSSFEDCMPDDYAIQPACEIGKGEL